MAPAPPRGPLAPPRTPAAGPLGRAASWARIWGGIFGIPGRASPGGLMNDESGFPGNGGTPAAGCGDVLGLDDVGGDDVGGTANR